jgi:hypothetical protein
MVRIAERSVRIIIVSYDANTESKGLYMSLPNN